MKLKSKLILLSLKMIFAGYVAEIVKNGIMLSILRREWVSPYIMYILEKVHCKARLCFINAEKTYNILIHHKKGLLRL